MSPCCFIKYQRFVPALFVTAIALTGCHREGEASLHKMRTEPLHLFIWEDSIPKQVLNDFEQETGIPVEVDYYAQLEVLVDRVRQDSARYDVIAPSDYVVKTLSDQSLLKHLPDQCAQLRERIHGRFRSAWYDPALKVCLPFQWSLSGLAYNKKHVLNPPRKWADLFNPARAREWAGRISLLDDARESLGIALLAGGKPPSASDPDTLAVAAARVSSIMPFVARLDSEKYENELIRGSLWVSHGYNGDLARAKLHNPDIEYIIPEEGALLSVDNLAIPAGSRHVNEAVKFMEYILRPEVARQITSVQGLGSTLEKAAVGDACLPLSSAIVYGLPADDKTFKLGEKTADPLVTKLWNGIRNF